MSFTKTDALKCVKNATKSVCFDRVSELSKEDLEEIHAIAIYNAVNSTDFRRYIKEQT